MIMIKAINLLEQPRWRTSIEHKSGIVLLSNGRRDNDDDEDYDRSDYKSDKKRRA